MIKISRITHPYAWELTQARMDQAKITDQPLIERPFHYSNLENGQDYYDLYGAIGWPSEVSDTDNGMAGYVAVVGVIKPKRDDVLIPDANFQLLTEAESFDVPTLLNHILTMRGEYGFRLFPGLLQAFTGDPERFVTTLALLNERLIASSGERAAILVSPPDDFYVPKTFDHYVRSIRSTIMPGRERFYFGNNEILKNHLREFKRDCPAVFAMGGLVHSLLSRTMWMDQHRENAFTLEDEYAA